MQQLTELAQTDPPPAVLHARPRERRVQEVAAVQKHGARLQLVREAQESLLRVGVRVGVCPHRGGETVGRVVHERERLIVRVNFLDADDRAEGLFLPGEEDE